MNAPVRASLAIGCAAALLLTASCARAPHSARRLAKLWVAARPAPAFDPEGPPDATRWALERLLSYGLMEERRDGRIVTAAAEKMSVSADGLVYTFHLARGLRFVDGAPCASRDFAAALERGIARRDHGTIAWALGALQGMDRVRVGKPLPRLGIETPDAATLVLRLARPDSLLPHKLALPGVGVPWHRAPGTTGWRGVAGVGPLRVVAEDPGRRLTLVRMHAPAPDTLVVRFVPGAFRSLALMRAGIPDWVWPLPPGIDGAPLPPAYRFRTGEPTPRRSLMLVMRADLPPTLAIPARQALAHALNDEEIVRALGAAGAAPGPWIPGGPREETPRLDASEVRDWLARGKLGRSFHVNLSYDADGAAASVARALQGQWARLDLYADLYPLRGAPLGAELLSGSSHLLLVEQQPLLDTPAAGLAALVMPLRGPAVGSFRTGWRTRAFDPWIAPRRGVAPPDVAEASHGLADELVVLPLADLPWRWVERAQGAETDFHPHFGPDCGAIGRERAGRR